MVGVREEAYLLLWRRYLLLFFSRVGYVSTYYKAYFHAAMNFEECYYILQRSKS
jgi:hypothetical protein